MRSSNPLTFLRQMGLLAAYCDHGREDDLLCWFDLAHMVPGDTDTVASQFGLLAGAFYGYNRLAQLDPLHAQFHALEAYLRRWFFGYDTEEAAQRFVKQRMNFIGSARGSVV